MKKSESKYFSTAIRMDEAFLELIEEKDFSYITVKEICERAKVNRSTFYLHYDTINDLLDESTQFIIDKFVAYMPYETAEFLEQLKARPLDELYLVTPEYLTPYLNFIKKHQRIFRISVEQSLILGMNKAYTELNQHVFIPILERYQVPLKNQKYIMQFFLNGLISIINEWLKNDCKESVEYIISIIQTCIKK